MDPTGLEVYEQFRQPIIFACLAAEKTCLLATKEWCTVPWSLQPERKSMLQKLMDIIVHVPPLMRTTTYYWRQISPTEEDNAALRDAGRQFKVALDGLDKWLDEFQLKHSSDYWTIPRQVNTIDPESRPTSWRTNYSFRTMNIAEAFIYYHAIRVLCLGVARGIDAINPSASPPRLAAMAAEARACAIEICRTIDYHLNPQRDGAGSVLVIFPLRMVWKALGGNTSEGAWVREIAALIAEGVKGGRWAGLPLLIFGEYDISNGLLGIRNG
jgi:hypothetical protein